MILGKFHEGAYRFLNMADSVDKSCCSLTSKKLIAGEYFLLVEVKRSLPGDPVGELNLTVAGPGPFGVKIMENEEMSMMYDFLCHKVWDYYGERVEGDKVGQLAFKESKKLKGVILEKLDLPGLSVYNLRNTDSYGVEMRVHVMGQLPGVDRAEISSMDMQERITAEVEREEFPKKFEVLGPGSEVAKSHKVKIEPGEKATFIIRPLKEYLGEIQEDRIPFLFNCSDIDFYRPDLKTALQKVKSDKKSLLAEDCDIYKALIMEFADVVYSNHDRRTMALGTPYEKLIAIQYKQKPVAPIRAGSPVQRASPIYMTNPSSRVDSPQSILKNRNSLNRGSIPANIGNDKKVAFARNPIEAMMRLVSEIFFKKKFIEEWRKFEEFESF